MPEIKRLPYIAPSGRSQVARARGHVPHPNLPGSIVHREILRTGLKSVRKLDRLAEEIRPLAENLRTAVRSGDCTRADYVYGRVSNLYSDILLHKSRSEDIARTSGLIAQETEAPFSPEIDIAEAKAILAIKEYEKVCRSTRDERGSRHKPFTGFEAAGEPGRFVIRAFDTKLRVVDQGSDGVFVLARNKAKRWSTTRIDAYYVILYDTKYSREPTEVYQRGRLVHVGQHTTPLVRGQLNGLDGAVKVCVDYKRSKNGALRCSQWESGPGVYPNPHSIQHYAISESERREFGIRRKYRYRTNPPLNYPPREYIESGRARTLKSLMPRLSKKVHEIHILGIAAPLRRALPKGS